MSNSAPFSVVIASAQQAVSVPSYVFGMEIGRWYQIATDSPENGLAATPVGTRIADNVNPRYSAATNPNYPSAPPYWGATGFPSLLGAWNSGIYAPIGDSGALLYFGGGHRAYFGNEVVCFDLASREFSRLSNPSLVGPFSLSTSAVGVLINGGFNPEPPGWPHGPQTPCPAHVYYHVSYCPLTNSMIVMKAQETTVSPDVGSADLAIPWAFNLDTRVWRRGPQGPIPSIKCSTVWDESRQAHLNMNTNNDWCAYSPVGDNGDGTFGSWGEVINGTGTAQIEQCQEIDSASGKIVIQQFRSSTVKIRARDLAAPGVVAVAPTLISPPLLKDPSSWSWSNHLGGIVCQLSGTTSVYLLKSSDNWASVTFQQLTRNAAGHSLPSGNGIFQRFRTVDYPSGHVLHAGVLGATSGAYAMRLA